MIERRTAVLVALAIAGLSVSAGLAAFQLGLVHAVWDPVFGAGATRVLTSPLARALPIPDAAVGAGAYAVEAILGALLILRVGRPAIVAAILAVLSTLGAVVAIGLAIAQPLIAGAGCTLCLSSTAISVALALGALTEARDRWPASRTPDPPTSDSSPGRRPGAGSTAKESSS